MNEFDAGHDYEDADDREMREDKEKFTDQAIDQVEQASVNGFAAGVDMAGKVSRDCRAIVAKALLKQHEQLFDAIFVEHEQQRDEHYSSADRAVAFISALPLKDGLFDALLPQYQLLDIERDDPAFIVPFFVGLAFGPENLDAGRKWLNLNVVKAGDVAHGN